jgi:pimeloyl-ACP methyl ester carboxylesterase
MGRSLGAHPALEIAITHPTAAGLILESGAGGMRRLACAQASRHDHALALVEAHEAKIRSITMPALLIHGERDELIPLSSAAETYDTLGSADKRFVVLQGAGHNDLFWLRAAEYFEAIAAFVAKPLPAI